MNTILTRLSAELIEKYEAEGFWQGDTVYALVKLLGKSMDEQRGQVRLQELPLAA